MEIKIFIKGQKEPITYNGDRIDVLDFEMQGIKYKQIRYFRKGISKSNLIEADLIKYIKEIND